MARREADSSEAYHRVGEEANRAAGPPLSGT
jgi:hypothetical protein